MPTRDDSSVFDHPEHQAMLRYRRRVAHQRSNDERLAIACDLNVSAMRLIQSNPEALRAFHARNHHKRRQSEVQRLERSMRRLDD